MPDVTIARRFAAGATTSEIIELPQVMSGSGVLMRPGPMLDPVRKSLPRAVNLVCRMVPWASVILAPRLYTKPYWSAVTRDRVTTDPLDIVEYDDREWESCGGLAAPGFNTVYLSTYAGPLNILTMTAHECWHMLEARLAPWMADLVDAQLDTEMACSYWDTEYHSRPEEIRARAFEVWCGRIFAGMPAPIYARRADDVETLDEIFGAAWSGHLAAELEAERREAA